MHQKEAVAKVWGSLSFEYMRISLGCAEVCNKIYYFCKYIWYFSTQDQVKIDHNANALNLRQPCSNAELAL